VQDPLFQKEATTVLLGIIYQSLVVCPLWSLLAFQDFVADMLRTMAPGEARDNALRLLRDTITGQVETTRRSKMSTWYLGLLYHIEAPHVTPPHAAVYSSLPQSGGAVD